jgi:hypothetical protein
MSHLWDVARTTFLTALLIFVYVVSLRTFLLPMDFKHRSLCVRATLALNALSLLYFALSIVYRGRVELDLHTASLLGLHKTKRFCRWCERFKPERAHHCSTCGYCVKKMDHHCMWLSNCINYDNQGHFIRFLFFTTLSNVASLVLAMTTAYRFIKGHPLHGRFDFCCLVLVAIASAVLIFSTGGFLCFHMGLVLRNVTFLEQLKVESILSHEDIPMTSPYDKGVYGNLKEALGPPYGLFLIGPFGDGLSFSKAYPADYWPSVPEHYSTEESGV